MNLYNFKKLLNNGSSRGVRAKKNIVFMFFIKGLNIIINLAYVPLLVKTLNVEVYGIWLTITSIVAWLGFFDLGLGHGLRNKVTEALAISNISLAKSYISTTYLTMLIMACLIIALQFVFFPLIDWTKVLNAPLYMGKELKFLLLFVFSFFCIQLVLKLLTSILLALQKPALSSLIITLSQLLAFLIIFFIVKFGVPTSLLKLGIIISFAPIIVLLIFTIIFFSGRYKLYRPTLSTFDIGLVYPIFSLGINFFVIQITAILLFQTNNIIISHYVGNQYVTEYNIAYKYIGAINMVFAIILTPFWSATTDAYSKLDFSWIRASLKTLNKVWYLAVIAGLILVLSSKFIYSKWLGNSVQANYTILILMLIYFIIYMRWGLVGTFINGIGKIRLQFYVTLAESLIHIPLACLLGNYYGLRGVLISMIFVNLFNVIWPQIQLKKIITETATGIWNK